MQHGQGTSAASKAATPAMLAPPGYVLVPVPAPSATVSAPKAPRPEVTTADQAVKEFDPFAPVFTIDPDEAVDVEMRDEDFVDCGDDAGNNNAGGEADDDEDAEDENNAAPNDGASEVTNNDPVRFLRTYKIPRRSKVSFA